MISQTLLRRYFLSFKNSYAPLSNKIRRIPTYIQYSTQSTHNMFKGESDRFNGIIVNLSKENYEQHGFKMKLEDSLYNWKKEGKRCIWFKIDIKEAAYVPILAQKGFHFHHARDDFVMMYKWLPEDLEPNLPPASHINLGVGAMVFNKANKILAISEKNYDYPHWKLPGGYVEKGEDMIAAAVREVKEETGIDCKFESLVTFRHTHNMSFGNSDIYVLLRMSALSENIVIATREIRDCKWMEVEEYTKHPHVHQFNRLIVEKALEYKNRKLKLNIEKKSVQWSKFVRDMNFLIIEDTK